MSDHDQRLKTLLKTFLPDFFAVFLPEWADRFDFTSVRWLDKEVFTDPPQGGRRTLDLVAELATLKPVGDAQGLIALLHVEVEGRDPVTMFRRRMYEYFHVLAREYGLPVLPIAIFLRVGMEGVGRDVFRSDFWELPVLRFEYVYIGLPALDAERHLTSGHPLGIALSPLMKSAEHRRAWLAAEAARLIRGLPEADYRKMLLAECVDAYTDLDAAQQAEYDRLIETEPYREAKTMKHSILEWREAKGRRHQLAEQLEEKFGLLSDEVRRRLEEWPLEKLPELGRKLLKAQSLRELGLED